MAAWPFKTCSGCIRAFESGFGTIDILGQTALQWSVLHPRGAELHLCPCSLGARNPLQAMTPQLCLDFARCDKDVALVEGFDRHKCAMGTWALSLASPSLLGEHTLPIEHGGQNHSDD